MKHMTSLDLARLPRRALDAHKGSAGAVLIVAGSYGMAGAAHLAAAGALRSGAGYVRIACPRSIYPILAALSPSVVFVPLACSGDDLVLPKESAKAVAAARLSRAAVIGPGLGETPAAAQFIERTFAQIGIPCVIDASALALLARKTGFSAQLPAESVLTPHPGEMARLLGLSTGQVLADRAAAAAALAERTARVAVLKGARTLVCDGERLYENTSGNAGMAAAGSGDVLSGVIGSLVAQGLGAFDAACLGVYLHGKAGDLAAAKMGRGLTAEDIALHLPAAIMKYEGGAFESGIPG